VQSTVRTCYFLIVEVRYRKPILHGLNTTTIGDSTREPVSVKGAFSL